MATILHSTYFPIQDIRHAPEKMPEELVGILNPVNWQKIIDIKVDTQFSGCCGIGEQIFPFHMILR